MRFELLVNLLSAFVLLWTGTLLHDFFEPDAESVGFHAHSHHADQSISVTAVAEADDHHLHGAVSLSTISIKLVPAPAISAITAVLVEPLPARTELERPRERDPPAELSRPEKLSKYLLLGILLI